MIEKLFEQLIKSNRIFSGLNSIRKPFVAIVEAFEDTNRQFIKVDLHIHHKCERINVVLDFLHIFNDRPITNFRVIQFATVSLNVTTRRGCVCLKESRPRFMRCL